MEGNNMFANDGSFFEKFKQLQEQAAADASRSGSASSTSASSDGSKSATSIAVKKPAFIPSGLKPTSNQQQHQQQQKPAFLSSGKLAFSLKQKSKSIVNPLKLDDDEDEEAEESQPAPDPQAKNKKSNTNTPPAEPRETIPPPPPSDPEVKKVADKLAQFVAKNGRQFEELTRKKNPGDTPFRFLFDHQSPEYKYYNYCVGMEEKTLSGDTVSVNTSVTTSRSYSPKRTSHQHYQTPTAALYGACESQGSSVTHKDSASESAGNADSLSMMEFYMKKAAEEDMRKPTKRTRDELLQSQPSPLLKKGHHMGDYIPPEELERFLAKCNDAKTQNFSREATERAKIQADNVGHRLLSKMGWKEGEGLGSGKGGRAEPVEAGSVKVNNLGIGAVQPGEVTPEDDIYEQYKKRMMLGYRYRPNPLNNPRKAYY